MNNSVPASLLAACGRQLIAATVDRRGDVVDTEAIAVEDAIQYAATSSGAEHVYLACSDGGVGRPGKQHSLVTVHADPLGRMRQVGSLELPQRPLHLALDEANARIHLAFNLPSAYACVSLGPTGKPVAIEHYVHEPGITGWFAHQALPLQDSGRVLLSCRGDDAKAPAPENPGSLRVLALEQDEVHVVQVVAPAGGLGFGPRNCAVTSDGRFLQVVLERQNRLEVFPLGAAKLGVQPAFSVTTLPSEARPAVQLAGDLCLHPTGRFVYVLNRSKDLGGENSVAMFSVDHATGRPCHLETLPLPGRHPRTVRLSADGSWMVVAMMEQDESTGQAPGICLLAVGADGRLSQRCHWRSPAGRDPVMWADFRERRR